MSATSTRHGLQLIVLAALAALMLFPSSLSAQSGPDDVTAAVREPDSAEPQIRAEALKSVAGGEHAVQTARQLVHVAQAQGIESRERAETLQFAARLYWYAGDLEVARRTLTRAGVIAYRGDEPRLAVDLLLDAADAALEDGDRGAAWAAAQLAGQVIHRSDFSPEEKRRLLARVVYADQPSSFQAIRPPGRQ